METGTLSSNKMTLKKLFKNAFFVICLLEIINSAASLTDSYFMGNYIGSLGMAAMGYARPFYSFVDITCGPLGLGMQLICSLYIGAGDLDHAQKIFSGALFFGLLISLMIAMLGFFGSPLLAAMYGKGNHTEGVIPLADSYLKGLFIGVPAMVMFGILSPVVQLGSGKKIITVSIFAQVIADVVGDILSVFIFQGGTFGLGLATAISYYFAVLPLLFYFTGKNVLLKLRLSVLPFADLKSISDAGASKAVKRICNTIKPIILNALSLLLGTSLALSVYSITNQVRDVLISFSAGATGAVALIGSLLYSQRDREGLKNLSQIAMWTLVPITGIGVLCILFAHPIAHFFVSDSDEVLRMAVFSIRCVGLTIPFSMFNGLFISFQQISQRYWLVNILSFLNRLVLITGTSVLLGVFFGTNALWWAIPLSEIINVVISLVIVWKINGKFPQSAIDLLGLKQDFGFRPEDYIELSVKSVDEVVALQDAVKKFCISHNIDSRRSFFAQLSLEELAVNVIEHGFPCCKNTPVIHIWITYDQGNINLRLQDNCPGFNVMKYCSELRQESPERCVGLRLVSRISKEMKYVNLLDTNNLMIMI